MTTEEFIAARRIIGWSRTELARRMACSDNTLRNMEAGRQQIPRQLAAWLARIASTIERNPVPEWRTIALS